MINSAGHLGGGSEQEGQFSKAALTLHLLGRCKVLHTSHRPWADLRVGARGAMGPGGCLATLVVL